MSERQEKRAEKNVVFYSGTPEMNSLVMRYDLPKGVGRTNLLTDDGVRPKVYVDSAQNYHFEVGFDHPENVKKVYVHSKRNGITKTVELAIYLSQEKSTMVVHQITMIGSLTEILLFTIQLMIFHLSFHQWVLE